jgi:hypothetical protein
MTMNLICFKHPAYDGSSTPALSCKVCCSLFISVIKERNTAGSPVDPSEWLDTRSRQNEEIAKRVNSRFNFDPGSI